MIDLCFPRERMLSFVSGGLSAADEAQIEEHLHACDACNRVALELSDDQEARRQLAGGPPVQLSRVGEEAALTDLRRRLAALAVVDSAASNPPLLSGAETPRALDDGPGTVRNPPPAPERLGKFEILRQLGVGGFGVVYLAKDTILHRQVALKIPRSVRFGDPDARQRFFREAQALARLDHPQIVPVFEAGEYDGTCYLAVAYCNGPTLDAWRQEQGRPIDPENAARIVQALAQAVEHAHQQGILHRDIKPANVLLAEAQSPQSHLTAILDPPQPGALDFGRWTPKLADFGLAKMADEQHASSTLNGTVLGTPDYLSPEQAAGMLDKLGPATDVYGLGAVLYELLTGQPPIRGATTADTLRQILVDKPEPPGSLTPGVPAALDTIVLKCLEKSTARRYQAAAELAVDLNRFLSEQPVAPYQRAPRRVRPWLLRQLAAVATFLLLLAVLAAALGGLIVIKLQTADGTLVVEVNEPGAKVTVLNEHGELEITRASDGSTVRLSVDPGKHRLRIEKDGFALFAKEFSIASGATDSITATLVPSKPAVTEAFSQILSGQIPPPPGLIGWWSGDGHAGDYVGGNHGILRNGVSFVPGKVGEAFSLDSRSNNYICIPHNDALNAKTTGFTIECWVQSSNRGHGGIISKSSNAGDDSYTLEETSERGPRYRLLLAEKKTNDLAVLTGNTTLVGIRWAHVAATFENGTAKLYYDGRLDAVHDAGPGRQIRSSAADLLIGASVDAAGMKWHYSCLVDELCLYNRALSQVEILAVYRAGAAGKIRPSRAAEIDKLAAAHRTALLANQTLRQADYGRAALLFQEAWEGRRTVLGPLHVETIDAESLWGECLTKVGNYSEAERHLLDSFNAAKQAQGFPVEWISVYRSRVIKLYQAWGKPKEAAQWQAGEGTVARQLELAGDYAGAAEAWLELAEQRASEFGKHHPLTIDATAQSGRDLAKSGKYEEALRTLRNSYGALSAAKDVPSSWRCDYAYELADVCKRLNDKEGLAVWRIHFFSSKSTLIGQATLGPVERSNEYEQLGRKMADLDDHKKAEVALRQCLMLRERSMPNQWPVASARAWLGVSLAAQQRYDEAEPLLLSAYEELKRLRSEIDDRNKRRIRDAADSLVDLYVAWDKPELAKQWQATVKEEQRLLVK